MKNYYTLLHLDQNATAEQVENCYLQFGEHVKAYAPGVEPAQSEYKKHFPEVMEAFEILRDSKKKAQYDQLREILTHVVNDLPATPPVHNRTSTLKEYLNYALIALVFFLVLFGLSRFFAF